MNIMIHHLHGEGFCPVIGSISVKKLEKIIDKYPDATLTFDDRLPSQELALDLLKRKGKRAYFFVVHHNEMEQDRLTRERIGEDFYDWFFNEFGDCPAVPDHFLAQYSFYTYDDRLYRFIRDIYAPDEHDRIMKPMRSDIELLDLNKIRQHEVGLHSYSHPRRISEYTLECKIKEYLDCYRYLENEWFKPRSMSHPMGDYDNEILSILRALDIEIGFRADCEMKHYSELEKPRIDVNNIHV